MQPNNGTPAAATDGREGNEINMIKRADHNDEVISTLSDRGRELISLRGDAQNAPGKDDLFPFRVPKVPHGELVGGHQIKRAPRRSARANMVN